MFIGEYEHSVDAKGRVIMPEEENNTQDSADDTMTVTETEEEQTKKDKEQW